MKKNIRDFNFNLKLSRRTVQGKLSVIQAIKHSYVHYLLKFKLTYR